MTIPETQGCDLRDHPPSPCPGILLQAHPRSGAQVRQKLGGSGEESPLQGLDLPCEFVLP